MKNILTHAQLISCIPSSDSVYALEFTEFVARGLYGADWNLGALFITPGAFALNAEGLFDAHSVIKRHLAGDYGDINDDPFDLARTRKARQDGRQFTSLYPSHRGCVKVVTEPQRRRTTICLAVEE